MNWLVPRKVTREGVRRFLLTKREPIFDKKYGKKEGPSSREHADAPSNIFVLAWNRGGRKLVVQSHRSGPRRGPGCRVAGLRPGGGDRFERRPEPLRQRRLCPAQCRSARRCARLGFDGGQSDGQRCGQLCAQLRRDHPQYCLLERANCRSSRCVRPGLPRGGYCRSQTQPPLGPHLRLPGCNAALRGSRSR